MYLKRFERGRQPMQPPSWLSSLSEITELREPERTLEPPRHQPLHLPLLLPLRLPQHQLLSQPPRLLRPPSCGDDAYGWSPPAMLPRQVLRWLRSRRSPRWLPMRQSRPLRQSRQSRRSRRARPELQAGYPGRKPASPTRRRRKLRKGLKGCASYSWISLIWAALNGPQCDYQGYCYTRAIGVTAGFPRIDKAFCRASRSAMTQPVYRLSALRLRLSPFTVPPRPPIRAPGAHP